MAPPRLTRRQLLQTLALSGASSLLLPRQLRAAPTAPTSATPASLPPMPHLWFTPADLPRLRERARTGWPRVLAEQAHALARATLQEGDEEDASAQLEALALTFTLTDEERFATRAGEVTAALLARSIRSDLGAAAQLQAAVIAADLCSHRWPEVTRSQVRDGLAAVARRLAGTGLSSDNPDNPFNNWWGVTHSAAALAALWLQRSDPSFQSLFALEHERVRTYLLNYGDHGHYYEGTGYGFYAMSHWGPYVLAARHAAGTDPAALSPGIARLPALAHALTVARPQQDDATPPARRGRIGMRVAWNDDGGQWPGGGVANLLLALAPAEERAGLRWLHDRLSGPEGDRSDATAGRGWLWSFLYYPVDTPPAPPTGPLFLHDQRTGLVVLRNRYQDADDCVFAAYAKTYHGGGHVQDDLGSWRLQGLGAGWSQAGGQAKAAAHFQSVVTRDGRRNDGRHGQVSYLAPADTPGHGGSVSLRLGPASGSRRWDRHFAVDYSGAAGVPLVLGLVDECLHDADAEWTWNLCYERDLQFAARPEENGFALLAPGGASLVVRFGEPAQLTFTTHVSPATERTFSNGTHRVYPGVPYITTTVRGTRPTFFLVATLQHGPAPRVRWQAGENGAPPVAEVGGRRIALTRGKWFHGPLRIEPGGGR